MEFDRQYLQRLIDDRVEETNSLEYKGAGALDRTKEKKAEITKDISAFANSAGGIVIYGLRESRASTGPRLPEAIEPVDHSQYSQEWLDQMASQIQPRIEGLRIVPIQVGPGASDYVYVVEIPQSTTAHQAKDLRYYKRRNFESTGMEDYEIRDVMNRRKHPSLQISLRVCPLGIFDNPVILVKVENVSAVIARYYRVEVRMPVRMPSGKISPEDSTLETLDDGLSCWRIVVHNGIGQPLFPKSFAVHRVRCDYTSGITPMVNSIPEILITAYADEMEKITGKKNPSLAEHDWQ